MPPRRCITKYRLVSLKNERKNMERQGKETCKLEKDPGNILINSNEGLYMAPHPNKL